MAQCLLTAFLTPKRSPNRKEFQCGCNKCLNFGMVAVPTRYSLNVSIPGKGANSWEFRVYPEENADVCPDNIYMADSLDSRALEILGQGEVFLSRRPEKYL